MDVNYKLDRVSLDTFAVNNLSNKLPQGPGFYYDLAFEEAVIANDETIKIVFIVNIYIDKNLQIRIGTIQTTTFYKILNFAELIKIGDIPDPLIKVFLAIAISTTRGMLLVKGAGTNLEHFLLPIINPGELFQELDSSNHIDRILIKANNYLQLGNDPKAIELYTQALKQDPSNLEALYNRSFVYFRIGEYNLVISDLNKLIDSIDKQHKAYRPQIYIRRGSAYFRLGKFDESLSDFNKAIEIDPVKVEAYHNRAMAYIQLKEYNKALDDINKALSINESPILYYDRGILFQVLDKNEQAIDDFSKSLELDPENVQTLNARAHIYRLEGKNDLALIDAKKAIEIDPSFDLAYGTLAEIYAEQNNNELFYKNLSIALDKGFKIENYIEDKVYDRYRKDKQFIKLINQYKTKDASQNKVKPLH